MKALTLLKAGVAEVRDVPIPNPPPGWVRIKVLEAGICGTDKAFYKGTYNPGKLPIILGHEFAGVVDAVGEGVDEGLIGKYVTSEINVSCGTCWFCRNGLRTHCPYRKALGIDLDGGIAEYVITPAENIHLVNGLSPTQACMVEPLAAVLEMIKLAPPKPGYRVAVLGAGTIGLLSIQVLRLNSPEYIVAVTRPSSPKSRLARDLGADYVVNVNEVNEFIKEKTPEGLGFDYVVEATGSPEGADLALKVVRPRGIVIGKSTHGIKTSIDYTSLVVKEVTLIGTRCGPFKPAIELIRKGLVRVEPLITSTYSIVNGLEALKASFRRDQVKVHIKF